MLIRGHGVERTKRLGHRAPHRGHQLGAMLVIVPDGRDGLEEVDVDNARTNSERSLPHHLARSVDDRRNDGRLGRDGKYERPLLERPQMVISSASSFGT